MFTFENINWIREKSIRNRMRIQFMFGFFYTSNIERTNEFIETRRTDNVLIVLHFQSIQHD